MDKKMIYGSCSDRQSVFDVCDELKSKGLIPKDSSVYPLKHYFWGDEKSDENIIGVVTVRQNEMYAITLRK